jgi:hypothetical protein
MTHYMTTWTNLYNESDCLFSFLLLCYNITFQSYFHFVALLQYFIVEFAIVLNLLRANLVCCFVVCCLLILHICWTHSFMEWLLVICCFLDMLFY